MKVVLDESGFGMKVVLDENFWDEKRQVHPNLDETVPNPSQPALALHRPQSDVAIALLVRSSLAHWCVSH